MKAKALCSFGLIALLVLPCFEASSEVTAYYVDPIRGSDDYDGSSELLAFRTIPRSRDVVRDLSRDESGDVVVYLRGGIYQVNETIEFTANDSGTESRRIIYRNYPDEEPILTGGRTLRPEWMDEDGASVKAKIEPGLELRQLYVGERKATRARTPNQGRSFQFESDLQEDGLNVESGLLRAVKRIAGAEVAAECKWMHKRLLISEVRSLENADRAVIDPYQWKGVTEGPQGTRGYQGKDYWVENAREFLDEPGEWFYEKDSGFLFYWPREDDELSSVDVVIPMTSTLIRLSGELDAPVAHVSFEGVTFRHTGWARPNIHGFVDVQGNTLLPAEGRVKKDQQFRHEQRKDRVAAAVEINAGRNIRIEGCVFEDLGGTGLTFDLGGRDNGVVGNKFTDIAASAIEIGSDAYRPSDDRMWPRRYLIFNNEIRRIGTEYFGSLGIEVFYVDTIVIEHNLVTDVPYSAISVGWGWKMDDIVLEARNARVERNRIERYLTELEDGSGIYSANPVFGSVMRENYIKDMGSDSPDPAIYHDGSAAYWLVGNNVIENASLWIGKQSWGDSWKHDILAIRNYSTTDRRSTYGVNRRVIGLEVHEDADWPEEARRIIERAGLTDDPVPPLPRSESGDVTIVDNADDGFSTDPEGWETDMSIMSRRKGYFGSNYAYTGGGGPADKKWAKWVPDLSEGGDYHVYIRYPVGPDGARHAPIEVGVGDQPGKLPAFLPTHNQQDAVYDNEWIFLGEYSLPAGRQSFVKVHASGSGITVADAVKFVRLAGPGESGDSKFSLSGSLENVSKSLALKEDGYHVWGGSAVLGPDGDYHLFYSRWPKSTGFQGWVSHSEIAHAVSNRMEGPYEPLDVALPARGDDQWDADMTHNPTVHKFGEKYYLYYVGNQGDRAIVDDFHDLNWIHRNNQRIGVAVAADPAGPWERFDDPVIDIGSQPGDSDPLCVSNPTVTQMPSGKFLMIYKAVGKERPLPFGGGVVHRVAVADKPEGPFQKFPDPVFTVEGSDFPAEDPYIWFDRERGRYFGIVKDQHGAFTGSSRSLALFESEDGFNWDLTETPLVSKNEVPWEEGMETVYRLERPQVLIENGVPKILFVSVLEDENAVGYNVPIPLLDKAD